MSHLAVRLLYQQRLAIWAAEKSLRVAYQGVAFAPEDEETYLAAFLMPAGTDTETLQGDDRVYTGVFQVSVVAPAGNGTGDAEGLVNALDELFPAFLRLKQGDVEVLVLTPVEQGPLIIGDAFQTIPASFQYRAGRD
jgi:hypothetical protein